MQRIVEKAFSAIILIFSLGILFSAPLAAQAPAGTLYGISLNGQLVEIALPTFSETPVGSAGQLSDVSGLAYDQNADVLYSITYQGLLSIIDRHTGNSTAFQQMPLTGHNLFLSIAFQEVNNQKYLYVADAGSERTLYRIDLSGPLPYPVTRLGSVSGNIQITGLAFHPTSGALYAVSRNENALSIIDLATLALLQTFPDCGVNNPNNIAFDTQTGMLYGVFSPDIIGRYDITTGHATSIQPLQIAFSQALAFVPAHLKMRTGPRIVGEEIHTRFESPHPYGNSVVILRPKVTTFTIRHPGATYIAPHFEQFILEKGDYVIVRSPDNSRVIKYTLNGKNGLGRMPGGFWSTHINGDSAIIELHRKSLGRSYGFSIDKYARGFTSAEANANSGNADTAQFICEPDDSRNAACYKFTDINIYGRAKPVARLIFSGTSACTGFLFGSQGHVLTNNHCIQSGVQAQNVDVEFMAEGKNCRTYCENWGDCPGKVVASSATVVKTEAKNDFTLLSPISSINPSQTYGYLRARTTNPVLGERIYIPQHPHAWGKRIAVTSSDSHDQSGFPEIESLNAPACTDTGAQGPEMGFYADVEHGASGSPVIANSDHLVVGLLHCGSCPNRAIQISRVIESLDIEVPRCALATDLNCPDSGLNYNGAPECSECTVDSQCAFPASCTNGRCLFPGASRYVGEDCCANQQCISNRCSSDGKCECNTTNDCPAGEVCTTSGRNNQCRPQGSSPECQGCLFNFECMSRNCVLGRCITSASKALGDQCCRDAECTTGSCSQSNYCQCKQDSDCGISSYCDTGFLTLGGNACFALKVSCEFCGADHQCGANLHCDGKPFGRCITGSENRAIGESCCRGNQCRSGSCTIDNGTCQCNGDGDCASGQYCDHGFLGIGKNTCRNAVAQCGGCSRDSQCGPGGMCRLFQCIIPRSRTAGQPCCDGLQCTSGFCRLRDRKCS